MPRVQLPGAAVFEDGDADDHEDDGKDHIPGEGEHGRCPGQQARVRLVEEGRRDGLAAIRPSAHNQDGADLHQVQDHKPPAAPHAEIQEIHHEDAELFPTKRRQFQTMLNAACCGSEECASILV